MSRLEDLIAWQLCVELRDRILALTAQVRDDRDRAFDADFRRSARSAPANLSEGFAAFYPKEFARFGRIARRSIVETRNHLKDAQKQKYFPDAEIKALIHLTFRAQRCTTQLIKYLDSCKPPHDANPF